MRVDPLLQSLGPPAVKIGPVEKTGKGDSIAAHVFGRGRSAEPAAVQPSGGDLPAGQPPSDAGEEPAAASADALSLAFLEDLLLEFSEVGLEFLQDAQTGRRIIRVYDRESGEVIRQIPPEEVLSFARALKAGKGALLSRRL